VDADADRERRRAARGQGAALRRDRTDGEIYGEVANIAARVQSRAEPGMMLITGDVHGPVSGLFVVDDHGLHTLKGVAEPVALFHVVRASGDRRRAAASSITKLVGREEVLRASASNRPAGQSGDEPSVPLIGGAGGGG
jgi:hypothetical protein